MSNAAYSKSRYRRVPASAPSPDVEDDQGEGEPYEDEEALAYYEEGGEEAEQSSLGASLFSSPARAITLVFSVILLFALAGTIAWMLGQSGKIPTVSSTTTTTSNVPPVSGSLKPVDQINNSSAPYASKPAGLAEAPRVGALPPNFQWVDSKTG